MVSYWSRLLIGLAVLCSALAFHASDTTQRRSVITRDPQQMAEARKTLRGMPPDSKVTQPNGSTMTAAQLLQKLDQFERSSASAPSRGAHAIPGQQLEASMLESSSASLKGVDLVNAPPRPTVFADWIPFCVWPPCSSPDNHQTFKYKLKPGWVFTGVDFTSNNDATKLISVSAYEKSDLTIDVFIAWVPDKINYGEFPELAYWVYVKPVAVKSPSGPIIKPRAK